jgi:hypothetical protein
MYKKNNSFISKMQATVKQGILAEVDDSVQLTSL